MDVSIEVQAKTVSNVYKELQKYKSDFSHETWAKIEQAHAKGKSGFFYRLLGLSAKGKYNYYNKRTKEDIKQDNKSQRIAQALHDTDLTKVCLCICIGNLHDNVKSESFVSKCCI